MPLAGYLGSAVSGYPVHFYGIALPAWAGRHDAIKDAMSDVHLAGAWILAAAVALHLAALAKHAWIDRDGLLARMGWRVRPLSSPAAGE
jgi:cytochrome b561